MTTASGPVLLGPDLAGWQTQPVIEVATQPPSSPNEPGGRGADFGKSSPVGLLVLLLFFVAVAFLVRSMTKHLKRVPASFDKPEDKPEETPEASENEPEPDPDAKPNTSDSGSDQPR